ncbi:nuclear transport factor 2 family protein [Acinetobacter bereziniae]|uniref:nuclear transport factor 2 family protein n=1 Tax=Acinetobacter bereziniae TaxID=106648 RepID=UPI00125036B5|nr:nuclear transport factor 2 family protein [Acinetobacter bereziniae]
MLNNTDARIETIRNYFRKVDAKDPTSLDLFIEEVEFFFPKFGLAHGKEAMISFAERIGVEAAHLTHDIDGLTFTVDGDRIVVEGREWGVTRDGRKWPDGIISQGRFANVFEFDGKLISRMYIYVDPDVTNGDRQRVALYRGETAIKTPYQVVTHYFEYWADLWVEPNDPQKLAAVLELFAEKVDWDIPGNKEVVPWIGPRNDRESVGAFHQELAAQIAPERFEVQHILADDQDVVAIGELSSRVKATGSLIETPFAFLFTIKEGKIIRYRMLEDSYAVAIAASSQKV